MRVRVGTSLLLVAGLACAWTAAQAQDLKSGLEGKTGGAFNVKAITGELKGKTLCYV